MVDLMGTGRLDWEGVGCEAEGGREGEGTMGAVVGVGGRQGREGRGGEGREGRQGRMEAHTQPR